MTMDRVNAILANEEYKDWMEQIRTSEKERRFCCHGIDHCLDVARIGMLMNREEKLGLEPELIYAAALLHDIGRAVSYQTSEEHHLASVRNSRSILLATGFSGKETELILEAISKHNTTGKEAEGLSYVIYRADKLSRRCFDCEVYNECYWKEDEKNKGVVY